MKHYCVQKCKINKLELNQAGIILYYLSVKDFECKD